MSGFRVKSKGGAGGVAATSTKKSGDVGRGKTKGPGHKLDGATLSKKKAERAQLKAAPGAFYLKADEVHRQLETKFPGKFAKEELGQVTRPMLNEMLSRAGRANGLKEARLVLQMEPLEFHDWQQSGMTLKHWFDCKETAKAEGCFIFMRPVNPLATGLIENGLATKAMDIHGKSADWGPQAGFIPADQGLSKKAGDLEEVAKGNAAVADSLEKPHIDKGPLELTAGRVAELQARGLLPEDAANGEPFSVSSDPGKDHSFKLERTGTEAEPKYKVLVQNPGETEFTELEVMGYVLEGKTFMPAVKSEFKPVTADYDTFAICPHRDVLADAGYAADYQDEDGIRDKSAAGLGKLTQYDERVIDKLNEKMQGPDGPKVVNHGPETSNPYPEGDQEIVMFTASGRARMVPREDLAAIWGDMYSEGHVVPHNHAWTGEDAGIRARTKSEVDGKTSSLDLHTLEQRDFPDGRTKPRSRQSITKFGEAFHGTQLEKAAKDKEAAAKGGAKKDTE